MPKPTKKSQLEEVGQLLSKASYLLHEEGYFERGFIALQEARAIIADLNGDIDGARQARQSASDLRILIGSSKNVSIAEIVNASSNQG